MPHDLPRYRCHKVVQAARITEVSLARWGGGAVLTLGGRELEPVVVTGAWYARHLPQAGGYYVIYEPDGYTSFSPEAPFEAGYTRIEDSDHEAVIEAFRRAIDTAEKDRAGTGLGSVSMGITAGRMLLGAIDAVRVR
jgi:hypothetical protein